MDSVLEDIHQRSLRMTQTEQSPGLVNEAPLNWMNNLIEVTRGTLTSGTVVTTKPALLFDSNEPHNLVVNTHKFGRFGYKVKIVFNPTAFHYGYVLAVAMPWMTTPATNTRFSENIWDYNPIILDFTSGQELTFDLPYRNMSPMLDLQNPFDEMWTIVMYPRFTRVNSTVTSTIPYRMFVQCVEPEFVLPCDPPLLDKYGHKMRPKRIEAQMMAGISTAGTLAQVASTAYDYFKRGSDVGQTVLKGMDTASKLRENLEGNFGDSQPELENAKGKQVASIGVFTNMSSAYATPATLNPSFRKGKYTNPRFLCDTEVVHSISSVITTPSMLYPLTSSHIPMLDEDSRTVTVQPAFDVINAIFGMKRTYLNYVARCFKYWRGSMKYKFYLFTSPFVTGVLTIVAGWDTDTALLSQDRYRKEVVFKGSTTVDVTVPFMRANRFWAEIGDVDGDYELTWYLSGVKTTGDIASTVFVVPFVSAGEDFFFAGPQSPGNYSTALSIEAQSSVRGDFVGPFDVMPGMWQTDCSFEIAEVVLTVEELLSRYSLRPVPQAINTSFTDGPDALVTATKNAIDIFDYLSVLYEFNRGSIRHKLVSPLPTAGSTTDPSQVLSISINNSNVVSPLPATGGFPLATTLGYVGGNGVALSNPTTDPDFTFELPYLNPAPARRSFSNTQYTNQNPGQTSFSLSNAAIVTYGPLYEYVAAGTNYQLGGLFVLANEAYMPSSNTG